jgi:hypothetical protein
MDHNHHDTGDLSAGGQRAGATRREISTPFPFTLGRGQAGQVSEALHEICCLRILPFRVSLLPTLFSVSLGDHLKSSLQVLQFSGHDYWLSACGHFTMVHELWYPAASLS